MVIILKLFPQIWLKIIVFSRWTLYDFITFAAAMVLIISIPK